MDPRQDLLETTRCLCLASRRAARAITRNFDQALRTQGLRATQFSLLAALDLAGPKTVNELAELLGAERSTVSRNLALVVAAGFVRSDVSAADARAHVARITAPGRRALRRALPAWQRTQAALVAAIGEPAARGLRRLAGGPCTLLDSTPDAPPPTETRRS